MPQSKKSNMKGDVHPIQQTGFQTMLLAQRLVTVYLIICLMLPAGLVQARTLPDQIQTRIAVESGVALPVNYEALLGQAAAPGKDALPQAIDGQLDQVIVAGDGSISVDGNTMIIDQTTAKVLLEWASFDIGRDATVHFQQEQNATAVNVIEGAAPSRIFGRMIADGQVYLLNENGVLFGEGAQVDVRGMIAAAARLNGYDDLSALTDAEKNAFLENSLLDVIGDNRSLLVVDDIAIQGMDLNDPDLPRIVIRDGAHIASSDAPVLLAGPQVLNDGEVTAENAQVVMAGTRKDLYLAVSDRDEDLRGYLVEVHSGSGEDRGQVINTGAVHAALGNVTLVAADILQAGEIEATTAVDVNGSIRILARDQAEVIDYEGLAAASGAWGANYFDVDANGFADLTQAPTVGKAALGSEAGSARFAQGSETKVTIARQQGQNDTATDSLVQPQSRVHIEGDHIIFDANSRVSAKGGVNGSLITLRAREDIDALLNQADADSSSSIIIGKGVEFDASGTRDTRLSAARNTLELFVTSNEVKDVADQKGGELLRKTIAVDIREGTELFDWEPALDSVKKTASERSTNGGQIDVLSTGAVTLADDVKLDVRGGQVSYASGFVKESLVVSDGNLMRISEADPLAKVNEIIDLDTVSAREMVLAPTRYSYAYKQGFDAGSINLTAPQMNLAPSVRLQAGVTPGLYQSTPDARPQSGEVELDFKTLANASLPELRITESDALISDGLATKIIESSGASMFRIEVPEALVVDSDASLQLKNGAGVSLDARTLTLNGDIRAVGGNVVLQGNEQVTVNGEIDTSGQWTNRQLNPNAGIFDNAGDIYINGLDRLIVSESASLRANAGAWLAQNGDVQMGRAGHIRLDMASGVRPGSDLSSETADIIRLDGQFEAIDNRQSGALSLVLGDVEIGGDIETFLGETRTDDGVKSAQIGNTFFDELRVSNVTIEAREGNISVSEAARIAPAHLALELDAQAAGKASTEDARSVMRVYQVPEAQATGGSLTLKAQGFDVNAGNGAITVAEGASIQLSDSGTLNLEGNRRILFEGALQAHGGQMNLTLDGVDGSTTAPELHQSIVISDAASIDLAAGLSDVPRDEVPTSADIIAAGSLSVSANTGYVLVEQDAEIDLSGGRFSVTDQINGVPVRHWVSADAGTADFQADAGLVLAANIEFGDGANTQYRGGQLSVTLDGNARERDPSSSPETLSIELGGDETSGSTSQEAFEALGSLDAESWTAMDNPLYEEGFARLASAVEGKGFVSEGNLQDSDLAALTLEVSNTRHPDTISAPTANVITVAENTRIVAAESLKLDSATIDLNGKTLDVEAEYVQLGKNSGVLIEQQSLSGSGQDGGELNVQAGLIDVVGNLALLGDDRVSLSADDGIQLRSVINSSFTNTGETALIQQGSFSTHGDMAISSPDLWVTSLTDYQLDIAGGLSLTSPEEAKNPVLSAGGTLSILADNARINGRVSVPFGTLNLVVNNLAGDTPNALTGLHSGEMVLGDQARLAVGSDASVPLGRSKSEDFSWVYSPSGAGNAQNNFDTAELAPLDKRISLTGASVVAHAGAQLDVSGGGDVYAKEFVAGLGGTEDLLRQADHETLFAIIPGYDNGFTPYDPVEFNGSNIPWGKQLEISGSSQVPDGLYTVMPANYALSQGAYLVSPKENTLVGAQFNGRDVNGAELVAGRFTFAGGANTDNWSQFVVEPGKAIAKRANYITLSADSYFTGDAYLPANRPSENGGLSITAGSELDFAASLLRNPNADSGTYLDIAASGDILVTEDTDSVDVEAGTLKVATSLFDAINADSLLLGGTRIWSDGRWNVAQQGLANRVLFEGGTLSVNEILVVAQDSIDFNATQVTSSGDATFSGNSWAVDQAEAAILLSNTQGSVIELDTRTNSNGTIGISDDSMLSASASAAVVFSGDTVVDGQFQGLRDEQFVVRGNLQVFANDIAIGDAPEYANIDSAVLTGASDLELVSGADVTLTDDFSLDLESLRVRASGLNLQEDVRAEFNVRDAVTFTGSSGAASPAANNTRLMLTAGSLTVSDGGSGENATFVLSAEQAQLDVNGIVSGEGNITLHAPGDLSVSAAALGLDQDASTFEVHGDAGLAFSKSAADLDDAMLSDLGIGGRIHLSGGDVVFDTHVFNPSGVINIASADHLEIGSQALFSVHSYAQDFEGETRFGPAGVVSLTATQNLTIAQLDSFDFGDASQMAEDGAIHLIAGGQLDINTVGTLALGGGGIDLYVQAAEFAGSREGSIAEMDALAQLNASGANNEVHLVLSGAGQNLIVDQNWQAAGGASFASVAGTLQVDGELLLEDADSQLRLYGHDGVQVNDGATLVVTGAESKGLLLHSDAGLVQVAQGAQITAMGGLDIIVNSDHVPDAGNGVQIDDGDVTLRSDASAGIRLYLSHQVDDSNVSKAEFTNYLNTSLSLLEGLDGSGYVNLSGARTLADLSVRPSLEISSDGDLDLAASNQTLDLINLRNAAGEAGRFVARAEGNLVLHGGLSDGVRRLRPELNFTTNDFEFGYVDDIDEAPPSFAFVDDVLALSGSASSDITLLAGGFSGSAFAQSNRLSAGMVDMAANSFVRTGTGDIRMMSAGDLQQASGAYIATLGKASSLDDDGLPAWNGNSFYSGVSAPSLWLLDSHFSGYSTDSGDVALTVYGAISGSSADQGAANFMHRFTSEEDVSVSGLDYSHLRTWFAAIDQISGGIHAIGGGSLDLFAGGDVRDISLTTPGTAEGSVPDDGQVKEPQRYDGGSLYLESYGSLAGINAQNDGGNLDLSARGHVQVNEYDQSLLLTGANTSMRVSALGDLLLDGVVNTSMLPINPAQYSFFADGGAGFDNYYFDSYHQTSLSISSIAGDLRSRADVDEVLTAYYEPALAGSYEQVKYAQLIMPSRFEASALRGDLLFDSRGNALDNTVSLFPDANASFSLFAAGDIRGSNLAANETPLTFYIADYAYDSLPTLMSPSTGATLALGKTVNGSLRQRGKLLPYSFENDPSRNHAARAIDREAALANRVVSLFGNVGSLQGGIAFNTPAAIEAYAGNDFVNASFHIQHNASNDLSVIRSGGDFVYPLKRDDKGILRESADQIIRIAGPGDLIVQAGGDIDLGTSKGIRSIANTDNPNLPNDGANIHVFAGTAAFGDWSALHGEAVGQNADLPFVVELLDDADLRENASFIDVFAALLARAPGQARSSISSNSKDFTQWLKIADLVSQATGSQYTDATRTHISPEFLDDYAQLGTELRQRIAVDYFADLAFSRPEAVLADADQLFVAALNGNGIASGARRTDQMQAYFSRSGSLQLLDFMLRPQRQQDLIDHSNLNSQEELYALPLHEQLEMAQQAYQGMSADKQLLAAEAIMLRHNGQSGVEGKEAGNAIAQFERGYLAQRMFFGDANDFALKWMHNKAALKLSQDVSSGALLQRIEQASNSDKEAAALAQELSDRYGLVLVANDLPQLSQVLAGLDEIGQFNLGGIGTRDAAGMEEILAVWQADAGLSFDFATDAQHLGDLDMRFSTIQSRLGGDISLFTPAGSINVGSSAALVRSLFGKVVPNDQLGVLSFARGDISSVVADAFNVNESRTIPLAGGDINLWSAFGDIDAGKGAKTAESTPPTEFLVSRETGAVTLVQPPSVSGSGITTSQSRDASSTQLSAVQRYDQVQQGSGAIMLSTPFGIVDAGEAGIQSAGDLFIAAAEVKGTDNISFGGISTGVPTTSSVGGDISGIGSAIDAATESVQAAAEKAATEAASRNTAFVTIELL